MQCNNAQCGGADLLEVIVYTCRVCGQAHTVIETELAAEADDEWASDDCED